MKRLIKPSPGRPTNGLIRFVFLSAVIVSLVATLRFHSDAEGKNFTDILTYDAPTAAAPTTNTTATIVQARVTITTTTNNTHALATLGTSKPVIENTKKSYQNNTILETWRKKRASKDIFDTWFTGKGGKLSENADSEGPILDFLVAGFPKCGTTAIMQTLATVTTMPPSQDVCTPIDPTVYYSYVNWARVYGDGEYNYTEEKPLKGSKCPMYIEKDLYLGDIGRKLPRTKLIVGIRDPVLWFQSFTNMQWFYMKHQKGIETLEKFVAHIRLRSNQIQPLDCPRKMKVCAARGRFHLSLAKLGKTPLGNDEIDLLQSELHQSAIRFKDTSTNKKKYPFADDGDKAGVPNSVFLFESSQGRHEYFYQELANFVEIDRGRLPPLSSSTYRSGNGLNNNLKSNLHQQDTENVFDICSPQWDDVRKEILPMSYTLGQWILKYLIPESRKRDDLVIPNVTAFESIVETFGRDPCQGRLIRNDTDGEYYIAKR